MTHTITLRPATAADVAILAALIRTAFAEQAGLEPPSGAVSETTESLQQRLALGGAFVAELNGALVGCVCYETHPEHLKFGRLAVLPEYRSFGIGRRLIDAVENLARAEGKPRVQCGVRVALTENQAWYERLGYHFVSAHSHAGFSEPTWVTLEKDMQQ